MRKIIYTLTIALNPPPSERTGRCPPCHRAENRPLIFLRGCAAAQSAVPAEPSEICAHSQTRPGLLSCRHQIIMRGNGGLKADLRPPESRTPQNLPVTCPVKLFSGGISAQLMHLGSRLTRCRWALKTLSLFFLDVRFIDAGRPDRTGSEQHLKDRRHSIYFIWIN